MLSLPETQALVMGALLRGDRSSDVVAMLRPRSGVSAERRLQVYRNNVYASLGAALAAVYPVVARLVGDEFFRELARGYVAKHPSTSGNLHEFGHRFAAFLRARASLDGLPYLADVAMLEWSSHEVYHEADGAALDPAVLAALPVESQPRLRLHLQLASRFVASPWPVLAIWEMNQADRPEQVGPLSLDQGGVRLLVARRMYDVEFRILDPAEDRWLRTLAEGRTLAAAWQAALAVDASFDIGIALGRHLVLGSFRALSLADDEVPQ